MFLGLDLGTSGVRALLMDEGQRIIGSASGALDVSRPHPGWSEQPARDWITATSRAIHDLRAAHPTEFAAVRGIGLSGQRRHAL
jgi:xylulokinase